ncbi:S1 family peptidase [Kribbella sp. NPDC005582]|uniref:S1 family peptidase n=1 Tax=Kribbella sp. NPDC005582 TaxID=3156893 RepID=UPI0033B79D47
MRLSATVPLLALGSVSLLAVGLTSTAAGRPPAAAVASAACSHAGPSISAAAAKRLSQPTSTKDPRPLGETMGEGLGIAVRSLEPLDATGRPKSGLPFGLSQGVIGVIGSASTGYKVVVDSTVLDQKKYQAALAKNVPAAGKQLVGLEHSCRSAKAIADAWNTVGARAWSDDAKHTTFGADLDPVTENILVEYDEASTSPESAAGLRGLSGVQAIAGGLERTSRLSDTPKGGHWGGARISSSSKNCSAGFSVVRRSDGKRGSVTAGHCGGVGTTWQSGTNFYGTTAVRTNYPDYDQSLLTGSSYGPRIWTDGPGDSAAKRTVTGGADPGVGTVVCQSGSFSTSLCGLTVRSTSAKYCDIDGCTTYVIRATRGGQIAIIGGDSGGPLYSRPTSTTATIRGIVFAGAGCASSRCTTLYAERYASISGHLGVRALTN